MSHDDIRAALEAASPGPWDYYRPHPNYGAYMVERVAPEGHLSGDAVAVCEGVYADANANLIMHAPTWLAELLAEVDNARRELGDVHVSLYSEIAMLTARAEAAEQAVQRVRWQCEWWSHGNSWNKAARNAILSALDGGEQHG